VWAGARMKWDMKWAAGGVCAALCDTCRIHVSC